MELEKYKYPIPKLDLGDNHFSGLESFESVKTFFNKVLLTIDNIKNNLHIFNTLYRGKNINELKDLKDIKSDVDYVVKNIEYYMIENKEVAGISGLKSLPLAADKLPELIDYVNNNTYKFLKEINAVLASFMTDEDFRKSFIHNHSNIDMKAWFKKNDIADTLESFIDLNTITDKVKIKDVIPNIISLKTSRDNLILAAEKTDIYQLHEIEEIIEEIVIKVKSIEENIETLDPKKLALGIITEALSDLGNLIRFHSLTYYVTSEVSKILINIVETLKKTK